jgi:hypothetical protein
MANLTPEQRDFDVSQFFDPDANPGEPLTRQVKDPLTGEIYGPGLKVTNEGRVVRLDEHDD